jgi:cellulose synthase/poly-beta-1,6-N-acetylglucosamine synthase-like glycosyltransferase
VVVVVALLVVFALARMIISWFPMDAPQASPTSTGQRHRWLAIVTFGAVTLAALRLGQILAHGGRWQALAPISTACGWAMVVCVFAFFLSRQSPWLRRYFGAVERLLYLAIIAWLTVFAVVCAWRVP